MLLYLLRKRKDCCPKSARRIPAKFGTESVVRSTFFFLAVSAYVAVVTVQRSCRGVRLAAMVLRIERIDCYVNQVQQGLADITVSVWILSDGERAQWLFPRMSFPTDLTGSFPGVSYVLGKCPQE